MTHAPERAPAKIGDDVPVTSTQRTALVLIAAVSVWASIYVERHRERYDQDVGALSAFPFAGGVAAAALATLG